MVVENYDHLKKRVKYSVFMPSTLKKRLLEIERNETIAQKVENFLNIYNWEKLSPSVWIDIYEVLIGTSAGEQISQNITLNLEQLSQND